jgi:predicted AlkP superfamily phosphohydrolase/phosphomutase
VGNSYLRINLAGREPQGIVSPGAEYEALLSDIAAQFLALHDPGSGERVVEDVYFPATQFSGPRARDLPDVAIVWNSRRPIDGVASDTIGTISGKQQSDRSGNHRPEGFALFHGPSFAAGAAAYQGDARQLAPLILKRFGVDASQHYEMPAPEPIIKVSCVRHNIDQTSSLIPA